MDSRYSILRFNLIVCFPVSPPIRRDHLLLSGSLGSSELTVLILFVVPVTRKLSDVKTNNRNE